MTEFGIHVYRRTWDGCYRSVFVVFVSCWFVRVALVTVCLRYEVLGSAGNR